ncbi:MAG: Nudix hydrolase protein [Gammaproteobacteria bacterium]|nr:Nudix hydrolase protein [Gammaproteobacteria bacterium]
MSFREHFYQRLQQLPDREVMQFPVGTLPERYKRAAVLLCFWPAGDDRVELVMTKRTDSVSSHQGQVSFPGGRVDEADPSYADAALRETWEELGIVPELIMIMGRLDDAWSRFGHHVVPYVGWLEQRPPLTANPREVAEILIADMATLMRPEAEREHKVVFPKGGNTTHVTKAFAWEGGYVWGLTADLLLELILWIRGEPSNRGHARLERMQKFGA